jgi:hypothetical protein
VRVAAVAEDGRPGEIANRGSHEERRRS